MNVVGAFMWVSVGATALHYWQGYMADHDQLVVVRERVVSIDPYIEPFFFASKINQKHLQILGWFGAWFTVRTIRSTLCC